MVYQMLDKENLRRKVQNILFSQGYGIKNNRFFLPSINREYVIRAHKLPRAEKIKNNISFIDHVTSVAKEFMRDSREIDVQNIKPRLIQVEADTKYADLFRWWNLVWWSLPYEKAYGRQMRFLVWDDYHNAPMGLIGLQSPILQWNVRDIYLNIAAENRDFLVNQSMNAQRLGALPPYNKFLCGKLVASLMTSNIIRRAFNQKYKQYKTLLLKRTLPSQLLFITTTGAYGKSSVYNRLKDDKGKICEFIGVTHGSGSFHIPDTIYEELLLYLKQNGLKAERSFGHGPSIKMKNISQAMRLLGFRTRGSHHGIRRAVYLFRFAKNLRNVIENGKKPVFYNRDINYITNYWKERWAVKRTASNYPKEKLVFLKQEFISSIKKDIAKCKKIVKDYL